MAVVDWEFQAEMEHPGTRRMLDPYGMKRIFDGMKRLPPRGDPYGRPLMSAPSEWEEARRETVQEARRRLVQDIKDGRGGQGDADKHLGDAAKMALEAAAYEAGAGLLRRGASAVKNAMATPKLELGEAFAASGRAIKDMAAVAGRRAALDHAHRVVPGIREKIAEETRRRLVELAANPRDWSKATLRAGRGTGLDRLESDLAQGYIPSPSSAIMPAGQPWRLGSGYGDAGSTYGARIFFKGRSVQPGAVPGNAVADRDALSPSFVDDLTDAVSGETVSVQADASRQALYREFLTNPEAAKAKYGFRNGARAGEPRWTLDGPLTPAQKRELYGRYAYADEHGRFQTAGVSYFEGKPFRDVPFNSDEIGLVGLDDRASEARLLGIERQLDDLGVPHVRFAADDGTYRTPRDFREIRAARDAAGLPFGWRPRVVAERELHRYAPVFQDAKGGNARESVRATEEGGDAEGPETAVSETPVSKGGPVPEGYRGPRIIINPSTFRNEKDAACVMWNEAFRIVMEDMGFEPVSEPTDEQRKFFSDTAYADDELQLRRTILARVCTFDTSVRRPTDEQLQEAVEFLENVMEAGYPQGEDEQAMVRRIHDVVASVPMGQGEEAPEPPEDRGTVEADVGGGEFDEKLRLAGVRASGSERPDDVDAAENEALGEREAVLGGEEPGGNMAQDFEKPEGADANPAPEAAPQPEAQAAPAPQPEAPKFGVKTEKELSTMGVAERQRYNKAVRDATGMTSTKAAKAYAVPAVPAGVVVPHRDETLPEAADSINGFMNKGY